MSTTAIVFDIESEPLPWEQLQHFYAPYLTKPADWSDDMVRYGVMKDEAKRKAKYDEVRAKWQASVNEHEANEAQRKADFISEAAKKPYLARILAIGYRTDVGHVLIDGADGETEQDQIVRFWALYTKNAERRWIGFNIGHYDIPLLVYRSWFHQIAVPESLFTGHGRYLNDRFIDLAKVWQCGGGPSFISLDTVCRLYGLGAKPDGVDGGAFAGLWNDLNARPKAVEYLTNDLEMTARLAMRMGQMEPAETE
jgi:predicted PolB exonuclease-like 3'-5' exonuclease